MNIDNKHIKKLCTNLSHGLNMAPALICEVITGQFNVVVTCIRLG